MTYPEHETAARLCRLLAEAVTGETSVPALSKDELLALFSLAKAHELAPLLAYRLASLPRTEENQSIFASLDEASLLALADRAKKDATLERVSSAFAEASIPHIPLKGAVLSRLYPESWTRTSCDIDLLVPKEALERALAILRDMGAEIGPLKELDVAVTTEIGVMIELHYNLSAYMPKSALPVLNAPFAHAEEKSPCRYEFSPDMLRLYALAHLSKHLRFSGCGIRFILDFWLIERTLPKDDTLILEAGLLPLARAVSALARHWFEGEAATEETLLFAHHIASNGVYGSKREGISVVTVRRGGKFRYILSRLFPPLSVMRFRYPVLVKAPWLLPLAYPVRLFCALFRKEDRARIKREASVSVSEEKREAIVSLLSYLGLED